MPLDLPGEVVEGYLNKIESDFLAGKNEALFEAIAFCMNQQVVMPEWVISGYFAAMNKWWSLEVKSLDQAFGVAWPKGKHLNAARKKRSKAGRVYLMVRDAEKMGKSINLELFEEIAGRLHINKTDAQEYYSMWKRAVRGTKESV